MLCNFLPVVYCSFLLQKCIHKIRSHADPVNTKSHNLMFLFFVTTHNLMLSIKVCDKRPHALT